MKQVEASEPEPFWKGVLPIVIISCQTSSIITKESTQPMSELKIHFWVIPWFEKHEPYIASHKSADRLQQPCRAILLYHNTEGLFTSTYPFQWQSGGP